MKIPKTFIGAIMVCSLAARALGFTDEGHQVVGSMADQLIRGTSAAAHVKALLGEETLLTASTWADQAKGWGKQTAEMEKFRETNPHHDHTHYTDIPFQEPKYRDDSVGATNLDVVHAINACILILQGKPQAQSLFKEVEPKIALRLLVHYVGDVHQPLHVGAAFMVGTNFVNPNGCARPFDEDHGGNWLIYGPHKLHLYWDLDTVHAAMANAGAAAPDQYAKSLLARPVPQWKTSEEYMNWSREWANTSLALSVKAHALVLKDREMVKERRTNTEHPQWHVEPLDKDYDAWAAKAVDQQLFLAGYRLAGILNAIWPNAQPAPVK